MFPELPLKSVMRMLMDVVAGAGNVWAYSTKDGEVVRRSEGLAVASLDMFLAGLFSDDPNTPHQVTGTWTILLVIRIASEYD